MANEFGTCSGKRVCTAEGLSPCDAATPEAEVCNGIDEDFDGDVDEPDAVGGDLINLCDDGNDCSEDICTGEDGCTNEPLDGTECADGDPCTVADHCLAGACEGTPAICDDNDPCTDDSCGIDGGCIFDDNAADCDDGNPCTVADECASGECLGVAVNCDCEQDIDCAILEDGDKCNGTLFCDTGSLPYQCAVIPDSVIECPAPEGIDAPCLAANCEATSGECSFVPANDGFACDDANACTVGDLCEAGVCMAGVTANCNDGNLCTDESCDPIEGCQHVNNEAFCEDGSVCTISDVCLDGECTAGTPKECDDGNVCTDDYCNPVLGCNYAANEALCDDGNACTVDDHCVDTVCVGSGSLDCDDANLCTDDACLADAGCQHLPNALDCDDGSECTVGDACQAGICVSGGGSPDCDDNVLCTTDCLLAGICVDGVCSLWGSGKDGPLAVGSGTTTINTHRTRVNGTAGETTLTALDSTSGLVAGTTLIVHQATGDDAGAWETRRIESVDGSTITLTRSLGATYTTSGSTVAQAVRVHEYTTATLTGGTLTVPDWDGSTGGILAIQASESVVLQGGTLELSGKGFRGKGHGCLYRCTDGESGESPSGLMGTGTSPARNGMAGGGGQRGQDCAAGGGGGYGAAGAAGANGSGGSCAPAPHQGGQGGNAGGIADTSTQILFGGAGGEGGGDEDGGNPGKGGDSGGILFLKAPTITITGANVHLNGSGGANGNQGACGGWGCGMSGGGGGPGGGAYLVGEDVALGSGKVTASGAGGGACTCGGSYNGGTGSVGRIAVRGKNVAGTTTPSHHELDFP